VQNHILGFKIVCSGKWKKTRSGRKQKLTIKFGQIVNSSVSNVILYDYSVQKTRFGSCSIKVWISHSKITN
jgi:ribosomal protein S3